MYSLLFSNFQLAMFFGLTTSLTKSVESIAAEMLPNFTKTHIHLLGVMFVTGNFLRIKLIFLAAWISSSAGT